MRMTTGAGLLALAIACLGGCAEAGLTLFGVGAGVSSGTGVNYTLDSIAYKTFAASEAEVRAATLRTLKHMAMDVTENGATDTDRQITAVAGDRTVDIELDRITPKTSRMRVNVKQGWFFRDRATAGEIIVQTEKTLDNEVLVSKSAR
jgi:hypothetical protein